MALIIQAHPDGYLLGSLLEVCCKELGHLILDLVCLKLSLGEADG